MNWIRAHIFIFLIFFLAVSLRFWQLGQVPASLNWDEIAFGYNAYSLGIDGKDEFGQFLPIQYLESYGDYKPPTYAYLTIIPVKLFGLNEFSVRFASAFFGSITVVITYFLTQRIFVGLKNKKQYALFAALLLAVSPWHINLSRAAFEANVATFFIVTGVWLFLYSMQDKKWLMLLSAISFCLSFYTFNTARIVVPILVVALAIGYRSELQKMMKWMVISGILGILLLLPLLPFLFSPQAGLRYKEVNIFSNLDLVKTANAEVVNDNGALWSKLLHNRRVIFAQEYMRHYFDNFNPNFLFISGDENHRFGTKDVGLLYIWEIPFLVIGFVFLLRKRPGNWWIIPIWILIGIIPAATARETPHALRIETLIPTLQIVTSVGVVTALTYVHLVKVSRIMRNGFIFAVFLGLFINVLYYLHGYYLHYPGESAGEWQYGYKDTVAYVDAVKDRYDRISMTDQLGRPYTYILFYSKVSPLDFRSNSKISRDAFGFVTVKEYDKYRFDKHPEDYKVKGEDILYIDVPEAVPPQAKILKEFRYPDGFKRLVAYTLT